jgi:hypothetical protein
VAASRLHASTLVLLLAACQPSRPAQPSATPPAARGAKANENDADAIEDDAMAATAALIPMWALEVTGDSETPSAWHRHAGSGTCMPKGSPSWQLTNEREYGPNDESVSLWSDRARAQVTLYTYPAGPPVKAAFDEALSQMASQTCSEGPVISNESGGTWRGACVSRREDGTLLLEQVMVKQQGQWLNKARVTFAAATLQSSHPQVMALFRAAFVPCPKDADEPSNGREVERLERASL